MDFWDILRFLAGPVIGAIIGIFTNYIAVKMLFRPYYTKRIGKFHIPFTPGIIPRRQPALAAALGRMVSEKLVRKEDLRRALLSDELTNTIVGGILSLPPASDAGQALVGDSYRIGREKLLDMLTDKVVVGITSLDMAEIFKKEGANLAAGLAQKNPLLGMFLNESTIASFAAPLAVRVTGFVEGDGKVKLREVLDSEIAKIEAKPIGEMFGDREQMQSLLGSVYRRLISEHADTIASRFHIAEIVERRVAAMPPQDLEHLILSVMRKELNAVIVLGSVIGFVMGIVTTLVNMIPL
ncbi:MAG: DUF445 family protein [Clostridia bacterium]|nr:DUF445 family protein [Clostridia bacterium]